VPLRLSGNRFSLQSGEKITLLVIEKGKNKKASRNLAGRFELLLN